MKWDKFTIETTTAAEDLVGGMLMELGIEGIEIEDNVPLSKEDTFAMFVDILPQLPPDEGRAKIHFYLEPGEDHGELLARVKKGLLELRDFVEVGAGTVTASQTEDKDWINNWKQYFKPFPVGEKLYIRPSWEQEKPEQGRTVLEIDPESSFGTGQHHTTQLCLELMEQEITENCKMLDMGCGSGILFIGGMLLGAKDVFAVDIEENAVRIAKKNAAQNHLPEERYTVRCGNVITDAALREEIGSGYDLITANIVADVLKAMAPLFLQFLKKTGTLIISGIIVERKEEVIAAMEAQGFVVTDCREKEGWAAVKLKQIN